MEDATRSVEEATQHAIGAHLSGSASKEDALRSLIDSLQQVCVCVCVCVCVVLFSIDRANRLTNEQTAVAAGKNTSNQDPAKGPRRRVPQGQSPCV